MTALDASVIVAKHGISTTALVVYIILAIVGIGGMFFVLRNYHRQKDFEGSDHVVPEDYD